jgi:hypothetical protein
MSLPSAITLVLLGLLGLGAALTVNRFLSPSPLSPVWVTSAIYVGVAIFGLVYPGDLRLLAYGDRILPPAYVGRTAVLFGCAAVLLLMGAACFLAIRGVVRVKLVQTGVALPDRLPWKLTLLIAGTVPALLIVIGLSHGVETLLHRPYYIEGRTDNGPSYTAGVILALAAVTISGYTWSTTTSQIIRIGCIGITLLYAAVFFTLASRSLAVLPAAFALGGYAGKPASRKSTLTVVVAVVLSGAFLALSLYVRGSSEHGLFPYLHTLAGDDPDAAPLTWDRLIFNVLSTFGQSGYVAFLEPSIPFSDLWPSLSPLPGSVAGWHQIEPSHRLDQYSPYSTIGELGNYGLLILAAYYSLAGAVLALLDSRARELVAHRQPLLGLPLIALGFLFPILSLQYQLRTDTRILYYGLVLVGIIAFLRRSAPTPQEEAQRDQHTYPHLDSRQTDLEQTRRIAWPKLPRRSGH